MSKLRSPRLDCSMTMGTRPPSGDWEKPALVRGRAKSPVSNGLCMMCLWILVPLERPTSALAETSSSPAPALITILDARGGMREVGEPPHLAPTAHDSIEDQAGKAVERGHDHQSGDEDRGRESRHEMGVPIGNDQRHREDDAEQREQHADRAEELQGPL